jgi:hypothetical protein
MYETLEIVRYDANYNDVIFFSIMLRFAVAFNASMRNNIST